MKKVLLILLTLLCVCGCSSEKVKKTDPYKLMENHDYVVIDVRTVEEYNEGHVKDSINIPYNEIDESIRVSKDAIIYVYCKSGQRSSIAYEKLKSLGYEVYNLGTYDSVKLEKE